MSDNDESIFESEDIKPSSDNNIEVVSKESDKSSIENLSEDELKKLAQEALEAKKPKHWECHKCDTVNEPENIHCYSCGREKPKPNEPKPAPKPPEPWDCWNEECKLTNKAQSKFCVKCGKPKEKPPLPKWICDKCGRTNEGELKCCGECGDPLDGKDRKILSWKAFAITSIMVPLLYALSGTLDSWFNTGIWTWQIILSVATASIIPSIGNYFKDKYKGQFDQLAENLREKAERAAERNAIQVESLKEAMASKQEEYHQIALDIEKQTNQLKAEAIEKQHQLELDKQKLQYDKELADKKIADLESQLLDKEGED